MPFSRATLSRFSFTRTAASCKGKPQHINILCPCLIRALCPTSHTHRIYIFISDLTHKNTHTHTESTVV